MQTGLHPLDGGVHVLLLVIVVIFPLVMSGLMLHTNAMPLYPNIMHLKGPDLNSWIRHYEPVHYEPDQLAVQHTRLRRNVGRHQQHHIKLVIKGHGRLFKLRLWPDMDVFASDVSFESTTGPINLDPRFVYTGTLEDNDSAHVHGIVTKSGLFEGTVTTRFESYHIEPVERYLSNSNNNFTRGQSPLYHSIIYKDSDVVDTRSRQLPDSSHLVQCASQRLHEKRVKRWLLEAEAKLPTDDYWYPNNRSAIDFDQTLDEELDLVSNRSTSDSSTLVFRNVIKRAIIDPKKTTCMLYLQADHLLYSRYGTEEACIEVMTRHVQRVNAIYRNTDFNHDGKPDNITFMVKRIKVHTNKALRDPLYRFPNNYGVEKFLEIFSEEDYDAFCLAYMFTYRDFEMGTLGLAWTGDLKNAGGVCEKNGHYRGSLKSLNTGIVTLLNYGKTVPPAVSHVTLAHEIGHNFGSPHDPEQCTPGGEDGNFIMFARATSGDKRNNNHFSACSLKSINPVLNFKARSSKGCFTEPQRSLCGNGVVEDGEQCDCGWEEDCRDQCCFPQRRRPPLDEPPCHLTPHSICSPSQGPCCTNMCEYKFGDKCRDDNGCRDESFCNGHRSQCPPSINKPNKTICNKEFVCFMGECTGSICLAYGLESCQCIPSKDDPKTKACELCCKLPGDGQSCLSSFEWNDAPYDVPDMYSKPGTPCNDYSGYCDVFQMCREVDPSGPLATLRKLLLSEETFASFKEWIMDYWYVVAALVAVLLALLVFSTKYLGRKKVKSITILHNQTTEAVRLPPPDLNAPGNHVTVHPAIRSKLPLKRKVRNGKVEKRRQSKSNEPNNNNNSNGNMKTAIKLKKGTPTVVALKKKNTHFDSDKANNELKSKPKSAKKKKANKRKIIDYSAKRGVCIVTADMGAGDPAGVVVHGGNILSASNGGLLSPNTTLIPETAHDPVSKVQRWLQRSHDALPKSKSTPAALSADPGVIAKRSTATFIKAGGQQGANATAAVRRPPPPLPPPPPTQPHNTATTHTANNACDRDKLRLQVVYKPPFKFSVKLRKPDKTGAAGDTKLKKVTASAPTRTGMLLQVQSKRHKKPPPHKKDDSQTSNHDGPHPELAHDDIDSNVHTVQSDLEVLLSDSEFLFNGDNHR